MLNDGVVLTPDDFAFISIATLQKEYEILSSIIENVFNSDAFTMDARRVFAGFSHDVVPTINVPDRNTVFGFSSLGSPNTTAAFIAVVRDIRQEFSLSTDEQHGDFIQEWFNVIFEVEEVLLLHPTLKHLFPLSTSNPSIPGTTFAMPVVTKRHDGSSLVDIGNRYFIFGRGVHQNNRQIPQIQMVPPGVASAAMSVGVMFYWLDLMSATTYQSFEDAPFPLRRILGDSTENIGQITTYSRVFGEDLFNDPYLEFLRAFNGLRWLIELPSDPSTPIPVDIQNEIDEILDMGINSVNSSIVMTTNSLNSFLRFNQGQARITEGRSFTQREIDTGARVAVISELTQGVSVGDIINIELYEVFASSFFLVGDVAPHETWNILGSNSPGTLRTENMEFEVIGLFSTPGNDPGPHFIAPNLMFIPDNSVEAFPFIIPNLTTSLEQSLEKHGMSFEQWMSIDALLGQQDDSILAILNTIIIPNGETQEFSDAVNAILPEYAAFFRIYDQGFSTVAGAIDNLMNSGILIVVVTFAGWLIALVVFILFYILRKKREAGLLYVIGVKKADRFKWLFAQCLVIILVSSVLVFTVSSLLYEKTVDYAVEAAQEDQGELVTTFTDAVIADDGVVMDFNIAPLPYAIPIAVIGQALVLLIVSALLCGAIAKKETQHVGSV